MCKCPRCESEMDVTGLYEKMKRYLKDGPLVGPGPNNFKTETSVKCIVCGWRFNRTSIYEQLASIHRRGSYEDTRDIILRV